MAIDQVHRMAGPRLIAPKDCLLVLTATPAGVLLICADGLLNVNLRITACYYGSECSRKKRSISLVASGPRGSV
jgi:hypothetical protein